MTMATRPVYNAADKASTNPVTAGNALSAEFATQAFPESNHKRNHFGFNTVGGAVTSGATPTELFIDGVQNFRFRVAERSTVTLKLLGSYNCSVAGSNTGFEITLAATNVGGTVTILANSTNVKFPNASTAAINVAVDAPTQSLTFTAVGIAGDAQGRWDLRCYMLSEVTDLG